ncbi:MAG: hypothetical protein II591_04710, partial [Schwartzia sp.]|nr:hypothetical protein [Schwartzia sp. (in: firmicutes)]
RDYYGVIAMFNIGMDIKFKVEPIEYPIKIVKENACLHCGKTAFVHNNILYNVQGKGMAFSS